MVKGEDDRNCYFPQAAHGKDVGKDTSAAMSTTSLQISGSRVFSQEEEPGALSERTWAGRGSLDHLG